MTLHEFLEAYASMPPVEQKCFSALVAEKLNNVLKPDSVSTAIEEIIFDRKIKS